MKKSLLREIRELPEPELLKRLQDVRSELYNKRVEAKTGKIENTAEIRKLKKNIARVMTELNQRTPNPAGPAAA